MDFKNFIAVLQPLSALVSVFISEIVYFKILS